MWIRGNVEDQIGRMAHDEIARCTLGESENRSGFSASVEIATDDLQNRACEKQLML